MAYVRDSDRHRDWDHGGVKFGGSDDRGIPNHEAEIRVEPYALGFSG